MFCRFPLLPSHEWLLGVARVGLKKGQNIVTARVPDRAADVLRLHLGFAADTGMMGVIPLTGRSRQGSHVGSLCHSLLLCHERERESEGEMKRGRKGF